MKCLPVFVMIFCIFLTFCQQRTERSIVGKWKSAEPISKVFDHIFNETILYSDSMEITEMPSEEEAMDIVEDMLSEQQKMINTIEFRKDGTTNYKNFKKYKLISKDKIQLVINDSIGGGESIVTIDFRIKNHRLIFKLPNNEDIEFIRVSE